MGKGPQKGKGGGALQKAAPKAKSKAVATAEVVATTVPKKGFAFAGRPAVEKANFSESAVQQDPDEEARRKKKAAKKKEKAIQDFADKYKRMIHAELADSVLDDARHFFTKTGKSVGTGERADKQSIQQEFVRKNPEQLSDGAPCRHSGTGHIICSPLHG